MSVAQRVRRYTKRDLSILSRLWSATLFNLLVLGLSIAKDPIFAGVLCFIAIIYNDEIRDRWEG